MITKQDLSELIKKIIDIDEEIIVEVPKDRTLGDYAVPCFGFAKKLHKNPNMIAEEIESKIKKEYFSKTEIKNGYVNFFLKREKIVQEKLDEVIQKQETYGSLKNDKTVVLDYSAPNIAKPFGVGHLRSTVIGNAIKNICEKLGYKTVGINYLGDCGTQFGKLIYAYLTWGNEEDVRKNPIVELNKLYVRFHEEAETNPSLNDEARTIFKKLEDGDLKYQEIWKWFREESIKEFMKTYDLLGINHFDSWSGESFYLEKAKDVLKLLEEKKLLTISEGATIVDLDDLTPALVKRTDGASLYITRDIAAIIERKELYNFDEMLYVVGNEQTLHFKQLREVIKKMGYDFYDKIHHVPFGLVLRNGKKMSTRGGSAVALHDVLLDAVNLAKSYVQNHITENIDEVSTQIGVGAVIFNDLKNYRTNDVDFNLDDILKFEGETGPYLQYTCARINSLLSHKINTVINYSDVDINDYIWNIVFKMSEFENVLVRAKEGYDPSILAKFLLELSGLFNKFYGNYKIINDKDEAFRLKVSEAVLIILKEGLRILGIKVPKSM